MKLNRYQQFLERYDLDLEPAKKVLNNRKMAHSQRVADQVIKLDNREDLYQASLYHDYLERGGNLSKIEKLISLYSIELVKALSKDEGTNDTLEALKLSISGKDNQFIADVLLIKLVDRWDNLTTKYNSDDLTNKYLRKSRELVKFISDTYPLDKTKIELFINQLLPILNLTT